jgi:hypothetical protein
MEKIQGSLKIQGRDWTVKVVSPADIKGNWGLTCFDSQTIKLAANLDIKATLIHEIIEVINFYAELKLPHWKIKALENGIVQALRDNKIKL